MKKLIVAAAAAAMMQSVVVATAQDFPNRPITIVAPFPAGGPTDTVARVMAERMKVTLNQTVVVENVAGAGGTIGSVRVARSAPDGYTLVVGQWTSHVGGGLLYGQHNLDVLKDFAPVSLLTSSPLWILGRNDFPAKDVKELIAWLKANPGKATGATIGAGSGAHMCLIYLANNIGSSFQYVPYRGGAPVMQDLLAGQIDLSCLEASQTLSQYRGGKVKVYAVMGKERWYAAPDVPTVDEGGTSGITFPFWHGLWAPRGTPTEVIARINASVVEAFSDPGTRKRFQDLGHVIPPRDQLNPQALFAYHKAEIDKWWPLIKEANKP